MIQRRREKNEDIPYENGFYILSVIISLRSLINNFLHERWER